MIHFEQIKNYVFQLLKDADLAGIYSEKRIESLISENLVFLSLNAYKAALQIFDLLIKKEVKNEMV